MHTIEQPFVRLPLSTAYNVRDLGGYACRGGGTTGWHRFLRGDDLCSLNAADTEFLLGYGVRTVIDLRSAYECAERPSPFAAMDAVDYVNLPLGFNQVDDISRFVSDEPSQALARFYEGIVAQRTDDLRTVFATMAQAQEGAVLFHCMVGKDRTGVVAALLLGLAGVERADIVSNYMVSFQYVSRNPFVQQAMQTYSPELFHSPAASMDGLLGFIDKQYGSMDAYLDAAGISGELADALLRRFCAAPRAV